MLRRSPSDCVLMIAIGAMLLAGCSRRESAGPIDVSVIGREIDPANLSSPDRGAIDAPAAVFEGATQQGLLRFDASGQIVAGAAARWIVSESGRSLIFRLPDDPVVPAISTEAISSRLRAATAPTSRNALKPLLGAIVEVDAVTPQVIDVELSAPRPNLLQLFAQPELGIGGTKEAGPFALTGRAGEWLVLRQKLDPRTISTDAAPPAIVVHLRGERAETAVARFINGGTKLVLGGRFDDLPIAKAATLPRDSLRFDPVNGLFGLAFNATNSSIAAAPATRRALSMAIDRDRIARLLDVPGWTETTAIVAPGTPEIASAVSPAWSTQTFAERVAEAARIISSSHAKAKSASSPLRIAMPSGPGARLLFSSIAADWHAIGVEAVAVAIDAPADLRLIDNVAPADTAAFYLRAFACERGVPCAQTTDQILLAARAAPTLIEREALFAQADAQLAAFTPFIALGNPIRWSLVAPDLDLYRESPRGMHPLNELRSTLER